MRKWIAMTGFGMALAVVTQAQAQDYDYPAPAPPVTAQTPVSEPAKANATPPMETGYYDRFGLPRAGTVRSGNTLITTAPPSRPQPNFGANVPPPPRAASSGVSPGTPLKSGSVFRNEKTFQANLARAKGD